MIREVFAEEIPIDLTNVGVGIGGDVPLSTIIGNGIKIIIAIAIIAVLFMLLWGAFQWIISGGDKEKVGSARGIITHALIGLVIIGLALVIVTIVGKIVGIDVLSVFILPSLNN